MKSAKLILTKGLLLYVFLATESAIARQCDVCSHPRIILYDAEMLVPRPSRVDSLGGWWSLEWPISVARAALFNNDPTRDCVTWLDGAVVNARDLQGGTLLAGAGYFNLPPAGEVSGAEYLLTGRVSGSGQSFTLDLTLETAVSREVAKTITVNFGYDVASQASAGQAAAAALMPLLQTIRNFEVKKRNSDVTVAIRDIFSGSQEILVTPRKTQINVGESVDVDIEMIDCDNVPLGNREISFIENTAYGIPLPGSTGGKVEPATITTDASGKAKVKFTAGNATGIGQIVATYGHRKPCGRASAFLGSGSVFIGKPPLHRWMASVIWLEQRDRTIDTAWSTAGGSGSYHVSEQSGGLATISAVVENRGNDSTGFYFVCYEELGDQFDYISMAGSWKEEYYLSRYVDAGLTLPNAEIRNEHYQGPPTQGQTGFEFHYPVKAGVPAIVAQCGGTVPGSHTIKYTTLYPDPHWEQSSGSGSTGMGIFVSYNGDQCSITRTLTSYSITGTSSKVVYSRSTSGTEITRIHTELEATLTRFDIPNGVGETNNGLPFSYALYQNYPNPFNPNTSIGYSVPKTTSVSLRVLNMLGQEVAVLVNGQKSPGYYQVQWNADVPSGVYFYRLQAGEFVQTKKMILLR